MSRLLAVPVLPGRSHRFSFAFISPSLQASPSLTAEYHSIRSFPHPAKRYQKSLMPGMAATLVALTHNNPRKPAPMKLAMPHFTSLHASQNAQSPLHVKPVTALID